MREVHPLTELIPERADQDEVAWSIAQNGIQEPVVLYEKKIIEGRVRYRAALEVGVEPQFKDWVLIGDGDVLDWMVKHHTASHDLSELDRIKLVVALLPHYHEMRGSTHQKLNEATGLSIRKIRNVDWLGQVGKLGPVLEGQKNILDAGRELGLVTEKREIALGRSYGHGDKFDEAVQPLKRYLTAWKRKGFEFRHVNPTEARRRMTIIDQLIADLQEAKPDLAKRSHTATLSAPPERKEKA